MASENIIMAMVKAGASRQVCVCNIVTGRVRGREQGGWRLLYISVSLVYFSYHLQILNTCL